MGRWCVHDARHNEYAELSRVYGVFKGETKEVLGIHSFSFVKLKFVCLCIAICDLHCCSLTRLA